MLEPQSGRRGGRRPGAGRKPSLSPLAVVRLRDPQVRAALVAVTAQRRQASGNPLLSQEQVVADLILAAAGLFENTNNQTAEPDAIPMLRHDITAILARLRHTPAVAKREGLQLLALLSQLIDLHAAQIAPLAILEELNRAHADDADRDQRIGAVLQQPHADYRQAQWAQDVQAFTAQLASGPIRRQTKQWALITLAAQISDAALVTQARLVELTERLRGRGIDPGPWLNVI